MPKKGSSRGGRALFSWEDVKKSNNNNKSYYLGHSIKAKSNRLGDTTELYWYDKDKNINESLDSIEKERQLFKMQENKYKENF